MEIILGGARSSCPYLLDPDTVVGMGDGVRWATSGDPAHPLEPTGPVVATRQFQAQVLERPAIGQVIVQDR